MKNFITRAAMWWVCRQIRKDDGMAIAWHCTLACSAMDEGTGWLPAQRIAGRFMAMLAQRDTCELPNIASGIKAHKELKK